MASPKSNWLARESRAPQTQWVLEEFSRHSRADKAARVTKRFARGTGIYSGYHFRKEIFVSEATDGRERAQRWLAAWRQA